MVKKSHHKGGKLQHSAETNENCATRGCIVCYHVRHNARPAFLISNGGGDWEVNCGADDHYVRPEDARNLTVVHFTHLVEADPSLAKIYTLPPDWSATRKTPNDEWEPFFDPDLPS